MRYGLEMRLAVGSDHAGFALKEKIKETLDQLKIAYDDLGTHSEESCDYPDYARRVARSVSLGNHDRGILCCGTGIGVSIVANKVRNVRAALVHNSDAAAMSRKHNDANILCLAGRSLDPALLPGIIETWIETEFEGERHARRLAKIEQPRKGEGAAYSPAAPALTEF